MMNNKDITLPPGTYKATIQNVEEEVIPSKTKKAFVITAITLSTTKLPTPCKIRLRFEVK